MVIGTKLAIPYDPVSPQPLLAIENLNHHFGDSQTVLADITFSMNRGEFVSVVGPSGCGKSTLLRLIAHLEPAAKGTINRHYTNAQMIFQESALLPWRTARQNIELVRGLQQRHTSANPTSYLDTQSALSAVGLSNDADKYPHQLSGGMKMRTALARSLVGGGDLLLCDEPFSAIDEITRESLNELLLQLHGDIGFTTLFVTHNISEAIYLSDRVLVLIPGPDGASRITADVEITVPRPRSPQVRFQQDFNDLSKHIYSCLKETTT